jgi:hypothetical protein
MPTIKRPDSEDVLKIDKWFFQVLRVSCRLRKFKFPPTFLGYLTGHSWGAALISGKYGVSSGESPL